MARKIYRGYARDGNGTVLSGATVSVYLTGTSTVASIYTASSGGTAVNSVTSDSTGLYKFYTDYSDYTAGTQFRIVISKTGYDSVTYDEVECLPPTFSTDGTLTDNSDADFPSEKAVKTYVDANVSDAEYDATWDGVTTIGPSKNAVYDAFQLYLPLAGGTMSGNLTLSGLSASLPVFTSSNGTLTSKSVADTLTALGVGAWTDYSATSTVTGWSSTTVKKVYYSVVNNIVFVYFDIVGTSSQTYARFTVPYNAANTIDIQRFCYAYSLNNGNPLPTNGAVNIGTISKSTAIVDCLFGQGTWTNSGDKIVCGQFYYAK